MNLGITSKFNTPQVSASKNRQSNQSKQDVSFGIKLVFDGAEKEAFKKILTESRGIGVERKAEILGLISTKVEDINLAFKTRIEQCLNIVGIKERPEELIENFDKKEVRLAIFNSREERSFQIKDKSTEEGDLLAEGSKNLTDSLRDCTNYDLREAMNNSLDRYATNEVRRLLHEKEFKGL